MNDGIKLTPIRNTIRIIVFCIISHIFYFWDGDRPHIFAVAIAFAAPVELFSFISAAYQALFFCNDHHSSPRPIRATL
jgi:hypothetical protein